MSTLSNRSLDASYIELLKIDPTGGVNTGISASLANVETGNGTASALRLSTTQVHSTGTLTSAGLATLNSAAVTNNATIGGTLGVTGLLTATGGVSGALTGNVTGNVAGNVTGNVTGNLSGNVNGTVGATTPNSGSFTTLGASGSSTLSSVSATSLTVSGDASFTGSGGLKMPVGATAGATGRPVIPVQGMLRYNTSLNQFEGYDGSSWAPIASGGGGGGGGGQTMYVRQTFTATAGQTTFTITGGYTAYKLDVFQNGVKLVNSDVGISRDVDVSNGSTIVLATGAAVGDVIDVIGLTSGNFAGPATARRQTYTATAGQTVFTVSGGYTVGQLDVFQNGTKLVTSVDVDVGNGSTFTLTTPAVAGDILEVVGFTAADTISGTLQFQAGTAAAPSITTFGDTNTGIFFPAADTVAFAEGGAEAMRIDSSGNVGIGETSPSFISGGGLHIKNATRANLKLQDSTTNVLTEISIADNGSSSNCIVDIDPTNVGSGGCPLILRTGGGTERLRIDGSGNVGIGTTSPSSVGGLLSTVGSSNIGTGYFRNLATSGITVDQLQVSVSQSANLANFYFSRFYSDVVSSPTVKHYVRGDGDGYFAGNVGIGTPSPSTKLDVAGTISASGAIGVGVNMLATGTGGRDYRIASTDNANGLGGGKFTIYDQTAGSSRVIIDSSGDVGIGVTGPSTKLHIQGAGTTSAFYANGDAASQTLYIQDIGSAAGNGGQILFGANQGPFAGIKAYLDNGAGPAGSIILQTRTTSGNIIERLRIDSTGGVTIAGLAGSGSRAVNASAAGLLSAASDASLKEEVIGAHIAGLDEILQIHPKMYRWKHDIANRGENASVELGFIANDVAPIIPSAAPMGNDGLYGFYDRSITAALVKAVQELSAKVTALEAA